MVLGKKVAIFNWEWGRNSAPREGQKRPWYIHVSSEPIEVQIKAAYREHFGPLSFLCYVNGMVISIDPDCKLLLYADDSTTLFSHSDSDQIANKLGKVLESCSDWLVDYKLSLHLGKTECILFGPKRKLKKVKFSK